MSYPSGCLDRVDRRSRRSRNPVQCAVLEAVEARRLFAAFPGASGPAMNVTGGRGGDVYHVTNLTDHATSPAAGSLRYGINNAPSSGRTIVFDVGGTIRLAGTRQGWLETGKSNLTIAGETAPGSGVTIMGNVTEFNGNNIILRHLKFRPKQDIDTPEALTKDALWLTGTNIIVDHVSTSWYDDEGISSSDSSANITVQYAIMGNGLNYNGHGYGAIIGSDVTNSQIAYHHNLFAHNKSRIPRLGNETNAVTFAEFSNNVVYNWQTSHAGYTGDRDSNDNVIPGGQHARGNFVGNTYIVGASNGSQIFSSAGVNTHIYQSGNTLDTDKDGVMDGPAATWSAFVGTETQVSSRFNVANITYESATVARDNTLDRAGAFWWARDAVDTRLVNETRTGTGNIIANANTTEWNNLWNASSVSRPSGWDTDGDGMPNAWESANGFNPNTADNNGDADGDGYRNIEEYLHYAANGSVAPSDTTPPTSNVASLPATTTTTSFNVSWSGSDTGGSGLKNYDVYVSVNGAAYSLWQNATTATSATYTGVNGSQYRFYSRARDNANNLEAAPSSPDATTTITLADTTAPTSSVASLPATTTTTSFNVSWSGSDTGGSGLQNYDIYVSVNGGSYSIWQNATTATSATYTGVDGSQYRFYSRARDNASNVEAAPGSPDATTTIDLPSGSPLTGWWKLDETSGTTVADSSGNNNGGTASGTSIVAGLTGSARSFDGTDDYVSLPTSITNTNAGSVAMWIKTGTNFADMVHLFNTSTATDNDGYGSHNELHLNFNASEQLQFFIEGGAADVNITSTATYADNNWHHVAATWDINGNAVLYVDGAQVASVAHNANSFVGSAFTRLGRPGTATRHYAGSMDDVRLYNTALSASEVAALATPPAAPPAGRWQMDETSGTTVADSSGNGRHGTASGASIVAGLVGNARSFDGVDDYVTLPTSIANSSLGTVAMWVKTGTNFSNMAHLFNTSTATDGDGGGSHAELHLNFTTNEQLQFFIEGGSTDVSITSSGTYADNTWHHVAATWDINGNAVLYVDGTQVGSAVHNATAFTGSAITRLGRPGAATRFYTGQMDDVQLFSTALSASEIAALATPPGQFMAMAPSGGQQSLFSQTRINSRSAISLLDEDDSSLI